MVGLLPHCSEVCPLGTPVTAYDTRGEQGALSWWSGIAAMKRGLSGAEFSVIITLLYRRVGHNANRYNDTTHIHHAAGGMAVVWLYASMAQTPALWRPSSIVFLKEKARRTAVRAADALSAHHQPQERQGAWH